MTEVTRVPLQPIAKGSIPKLWAGVAAALLVAAGVAFAAKPPLVDVRTLSSGQGANPQASDVVIINYKGALPDGKVFDQHNGAVFPVTGTIPGFTKALMQMQRGGKYKVHIPASLGYGAAGAPPTIPANADLTFDVELLDFMNAQAYQQQMMMMQQMQRMQGQRGGAAGAMPGGAAPEGAAPEGVPVQ